MSTYELGRQRLIKQVKAMSVKWSPEPLRKECLAIAKRLTDLADDLDGASIAWGDIENEHDKEPTRSTGADGYPVSQTDFSCSFKATLNDMRVLAESAQRAAQSLPNSRRRFALPFAAMGLLHLMVWHGKTVVPIAVDSPSVLALREICEASGIHLSEEALRNALRDEFNQFDLHYPRWPPQTAPLMATQTAPGRTAKLSTLWSGWL